MTSTIITKTYNTDHSNTDHSNTAMLTFREDGWFNMTSAARTFGKRLDHFWENAETTTYMLELSITLGMNPGIPGITPRVPAYKGAGYQELKNTLCEAHHGHFSKPDTGTWAHPKLAVFFARWLDTKFSVWCDAVIDDILRGKAEVVITKPETSEIMKMPTSLLEAGQLWLAELEKADSEDYPASI